MIRLNIDGEPIAWKRPGRNNHTGAIYDQQKKEKEQVRWIMRATYRNKPQQGPVAVTFRFSLPIPKSTTAPKRREMINGVLHHINKPDCDNLEKFYLDCMTGVIYDDDCQVCQKSCDKVYAENPGVYIEIKPLHDNHKHEVRPEDHEVDTGDE